MANEYATGSDMFKPEVLGDVINTWLYNNYALIGSGYIGEINGAVWNKGGATVTFPTYAGFVASTAVQTLPDNGTAVESKKISMGSYTKTVASKIISLALTGIAIEDALSDVDLADNIITQVGEAVKTDIDKALITEAETSDLAHTIATNITFADIVKAKMLWLDKAQGMDAALVVHSKVYGDTIALDEVKTFNNWGGAGTIQTGAVPYIAGLPVFVSDNITTVAGTPNTYRNLIVAKDALQFGLRRAVTMEVKTVPGNDVKYLDFTYRYVTHLKQSNPKGVVKLTTR